MSNSEGDGDFPTAAVLDTGVILYNGPTCGNEFEPALRPPVLDMSGPPMSNHGVFGGNPQWSKRISSTAILT